MFRILYDPSSGIVERA